ncbi:hypothetical protein L6164_024454 [Bauhinia variegata]|uniref:Uncharacterized protein n=1 Tax=Bauhinia variegata TaxID=167791 RepID=A0ACB9LXT6_BAUVA|nr:hypothetical protein L6164_024454 [Bauhinia variegata]
MALSSATATAYIAGKNIATTRPTKFGFSTWINFSTKSRKLYIRSSGDGSAETTTTETDSESFIEVPQESPSLISALNVERALRGIPITDVDHYGRLGLQRKCSLEQVTVAYKNKIEELESQGLEEDELNKRSELIKESYRILSSEQERRIYDWSLARTENPDTYAWPFEADDVTKTWKGTPPQEPEDEGPTRLVGYFFLGWIVLSFALSIALNLN